MKLSDSQLELINVLGDDWLDVPAGKDEALQQLLSTLALEQVRLDSRVSGDKNRR